MGDERDARDVHVALGDQLVVLLGPLHNLEDRHGVGQPDVLDGDAELHHGPGQNTVIIVLYTVLLGSVSVVLLMSKPTRGCTPRSRRSQSLHFIQYCSQ